MAANLQQMAGHGPMMQQQQPQQKPGYPPVQVQRFMVSFLSSNPQSITPGTWQASMTLAERMSKALQL
jgi:hypothetical protein